MTTPLQGPLVSAVAFKAMEVDAIAEALKAHAFELVALGPRNIVGSRPVAGHSDVAREASFWRVYDGAAWTGQLTLRYPHPRAGELCGSKLNAPGARYPSLTMRLLHQLPRARTLDELEAWLGGVVAIPVDDTERAAIGVAPMLVAWWTGGTFTKWHVDGNGGCTRCGRQVPSNPAARVSRRTEPAADACELCSTAILPSAPGSV